MASAVAVRLGKHGFKASVDDLSDECLLEKFLSRGGSEADQAFQALVERHGPMVLGICRHVLNQHQDAEDAFQATFLVLARKADSIRNRRVIAGWLHEVAHRIAIKARASAVRRRTLERQGMAMSPSTVEMNNQDQAVAWNELRPVLHAEVERLPERYRIPVILSYLEGKTNEEVAALLQWPVGTVKGRLSRARDLLRSRLMRRGLTLSAAFLMTALSHGTVFAEVVPADLVKRTVRLAAKFGAPSAPPDPSDPQGLVEPGLTDPLDDATKTISPRLKLSAQKLGLVLLAILTFSVATGIGMAAFNPSRFSDLRTAFSSFIPGNTGARSGGSCH
jgi:RNA polymerase sigma-70 factor (ECF subfamily)